MRLTVDIFDLAPGGEGAARCGERALFVPFTAPGDRVEVEAPPGDGPAHATLLRVIARGAGRVEPPCRHFGPAEPAGVAAERGCGGCEWLHLAYGAQLEPKARAVAEALRRIGRLAPGTYPMRPLAPSPRALRYRSRAKLHFDRQGRRLVFFRRRSHEPVPVSECHLLEAGLEEMRAALGPALAEARLAPREVAIEWSAHESRGSAALALPDVSSAVRARAEALLRAAPLVKGLVLTTEHGAAQIVGDPVLLHERRPGDPCAGLVRSRPDVFQQANRYANAVLVETAVALLEPAGLDVLELFCGSGNFTGALAPLARSVAAVEAQGPALDLARLDLGDAASAAGAEDRPGGAASPPSSNADVRFFAGDALALARAFARESGPGARRFAAALLDPPREGAKGIGPALRDLQVPRVVYVSCDPATFARDLRGCVEAGYRVAAVQPVDMFPQTHHVEAVALLVSGK